MQCWIVLRLDLMGVPRFQMKDAIVKDVCQFYIIDRVRSAIEDFKAGLQTLGILNLIEKHPNTMAQVFCSSSLLAEWTPCFCQN